MRLTVHRSNTHIYAQVIDAPAAPRCWRARRRWSRTCARTSRYGGNVKAAAEIGKRIAEKAKQLGIAAVAFDRVGLQVSRPREGAGRSGARSRPEVLGGRTDHGETTGISQDADRRESAARRAAREDGRGQPRHQGREGRTRARLRGADRGRRRRRRHRHGQGQGARSAGRGAEGDGRSAPQDGQGARSRTARCSTR